MLPVRISVLGKLAAPLVAAVLVTAPAPADAQTQLDTSRQLAGMVARMGQLEEEIRRLRGQVEELEFRLQRAEGQFQAAPATVPPPAPTAAAERVPEPSSELPVAGGPTVPTPPPVQTAAIDPDAPPRERYEAGLQLLQRGDWPAAEAAFEGLIEDHPDDPLAGNAAYWLGETFYIRKDYPSAAAVFARNYRTYGADAAKAPDNLLKLGMSLGAMGDRERACQTFAELDRRHPNASAPIKQTLVRERSAVGCG
jgi:tol-pal system protein YbgF